VSACSVWASQCTEILILLTIRKAAYDQLTPALVALFGRHALASQRLIWCNNKSNDGATKKAREHFVSLKSDLTAVMKYAVSNVFGRLGYVSDLSAGYIDMLLARKISCHSDAWSARYERGHSVRFKRLYDRF
jgi:hypothetical protein